MAGRFGPAVVGLALLAAACGGGDGGDGAPSGAKGAFVAMADPICAEVNQAVGDLASEPEKELEPLRKGLERLEALRAPGEDLERWQLFLVEYKNVLLSIEALVNSDGQRRDAAEAAENAAERARAAAEAYGLDDCAQGPGSGG